ncbi:MAG: hypothetical protein ACLPNY_23275 [Roseiarcus sp.]
MKIAVVAWGSVIWEPRNLRVLGRFEPTELRLPIEFCRVSDDRRLSLVVDGKFGTPCRTHIATSEFDELKGAIEDLRAREKTNEKYIGFVEGHSGKSTAMALSDHAKTIETVGSWIVENGYDAAVWTALPNNFSDQDRANEPFTVDAAIRYLETLDKEKLECALNYVRRAPQEVQTPVRTAVNARWPRSGEIRGQQC